jgi:hypothetical protein
LRREKLWVARQRIVEIGLKRQRRFWHNVLIATIAD